MSVWDWVHEFHDEAEANGDEERLRLWQLQQQAFQHGKTNPALMLSALEEGKALAQRLREPWWAMLFDHWRLQCQMHYLLDYRPAVELAVRATLEARKPPYADLPQRVCLHDDLVNTYLGVDPLGHEEVIEKALDFMACEIRDDFECRYCLQNRRRDFALTRDRLEEAEECSHLQLEMAEQDGSFGTGDHHAVFAYSGLCDVAMRRGDWASIAEYASEGEEKARRSEDYLYLATFLLLRALLARRAGEEGRAQKLHGRALRERRRVQALPGVFYYDVLCTFHETGGDLEQALEARTAHLEETVGKGRLHDECECHVKRCALLARMGRLRTEDVEAARSAARRLRKPEKALALLDRLTSEEGSQGEDG